MGAVQAAFGFDGLLLLVVAVFVAGIVRGFSGFGTAMVFMPVAATVAEPIHAMIMMFVFDLFGPIPLVPRALRDGEPKDVGLLGIGAFFGLIIGVTVLTMLEPLWFRWGVSILALTLLVLLVSGWRYRNPLRPMATVAVGWIGGVLGGVAALPGPPVILSYMSSPRPPEAIRANSLLYLVLVDVMAFLVFAAKGLLVLKPLLIGAILILPYTIGGLVGARIFDPEREALYRRVAYVLIACSAIFGMPIWGE